MTDVHHAHGDVRPDQATVRDIIERRNAAFDDVDVRKVALYVAHVNKGRSLRSLARQTRKSTRRIKRSIRYVHERLKEEFPAYVEDRDLGEQFD